MWARRTVSRKVENSPAFPSPDMLGQTWEQKHPPFVLRLERCLCYLKRNPSGLSCCSPSSGGRFQCPSLSPVCCPAVIWVVRGVCAVQASSGWPGEGQRGLHCWDTHSMLWDRAQPRLWLIPKLGQPSESWEEPGMTEGVLNSSSDYSFCESGFVCIN